MKTLGFFWIVSWLLRSGTGRLILLAVALWYLDNRYFGLLAALWAPVARAQRIGGLRRAVEINPSDVRSMVELGDHYLHGGNPRLAAEYLERAVARREDTARTLYLLGGALVKLGRYDEGRARLEAAVAQQPGIAYGEPYLFLLEATLATAGAASPRVEELVAPLDTFNSLENLTRAGRLLAAAGRKDLARRLYDEAIHNYTFVPRAFRKRERRWLVRARLGRMLLG